MDDNLISFFMLDNSVEIQFAEFEVSVVFNFVGVDDSIPHTGFFFAVSYSFMVCYSSVFFDSRFSEGFGFALDDSFFFIVSIEVQFFGSYYTSFFDYFFGLFVCSFFFFYFRCDRSSERPSAVS